MVKAFIALLAALPDILKLIEFIQAAMKENEIKGKVKDNVKAIHSALEKGDENSLNNIFRRDPK